jgi:hypothetical protein
VAQSALLFAVAFPDTDRIAACLFSCSPRASTSRRKLVQLVGPSLTRKKEAVRILEEIDVQVQRYLLSMLVSNTLVGVATWGAFQALGLQHAGVGASRQVSCTSFPYLDRCDRACKRHGAFLQFGSILNALTVAGARWSSRGCSGFWLYHLATEPVRGVNAAVLFMQLLFFGWLWVSQVCCCCAAARRSSQRAFVKPRQIASEPAGESARRARSGSPFEQARIAASPMCVSSKIAMFRP